MASELTALTTHAHPLFFVPRLLVTGYVNAVDKVAATFNVVTFNWLQGGSFHNQLTIIGYFKPTNQYSITNTSMPNIMPNTKGLIFFSGIMLGMKNASVTLAVDTITFLNKKAQPPAKLHIKPKKRAVIPHHRSLGTALQMAKKNSGDTYWDAFFEKEREFLTSD